MPLLSPPGRDSMDPLLGRARTRCVSATDPDSGLQALDERGFAILRDALSPAILERVRAAHDRVYAHERRAGRLGAGGSLHALGALARGHALPAPLDPRPPPPLP